jgi:DNA-binding SARP family transcriptional activator
MSGVAVKRYDRECAFSLLGPMAVKINGAVCTPSASKIRRILALMLLMGDQMMTLDTAIQELWDDRPPRTAITVVQTYVYQLRKLLAQHRNDWTIRTVGPGYVLNLPAEEIDSWRFIQQVKSGRDAMERGDVRQAAALLTTALEMWRGEVLEDLPHGTILNGHAARLREQRMLGLELRLSANMNLGRHRELIPELKSLVAEHPYHEWLHAQLMVSLHRSGRRGEALNAYQEVRRVLNSDLGLEPSQALQKIQQSVLNAEAIAPHVTGAWSVSPPTASRS